MLLQLMAQEAGLHVDMVGFQAAMEEAKELSRAGEQFVACVRMGAVLCCAADVLVEGPWRRPRSCRTRVSTCVPISTCRLNWKRAADAVVQGLEAAEELPRDCAPTWLCC